MFLPSDKILVRSQPRALNREIISLGCLVGHDREPFHLLFQSMCGQRSTLGWASGRLWLSLSPGAHLDWFAHLARTIRLLDHLDSAHGSCVDLDTVGLVITWVRVYVVRLQIVTIDQTALGWLRVRIAISVEGGLSKVGRYGWVWQKSAFQLQFMLPLLNVLQLGLCQRDILFLVLNLFRLFSPHWCFSFCFLGLLSYLVVFAWTDFFLRDVESVSNHCRGLIFEPVGLKRCLKLALLHLERCDELCRFLG